MLCIMSSYAGLGASVSPSSVWQRKGRRLERVDQDIQGIKPSYLHQIPLHGAACLTSR